MELLVLRELLTVPADGSVCGMSPSRWNARLHWLNALALERHLKQHYRIMARLGVEPRPSGYIPGALPIELPSPGYKVVLPLYYHHCGRLDIQQDVH